MTDSDFWFFMPINPEPWAIGPLGVGKKAGKPFPFIGQNTQLKFYQEAIKEALNGQNPLPEGQYRLTFFCWRALDSYEGQKGSRIRKHQIDATNIQKATEDALQGVLFANDRDVRDVRTVVVEQDHNTVPGIVIHAQLWVGLDPKEIPEFIWSKLDSNSVELSFDQYQEQMHSYHKEEPEIF